MADENNNDHGLRDENGDTPLNAVYDYPLRSLGLE